MKYIKKFSQVTEYQQFVGGGEYVTPNLCFITETMGLVIKPKINNGGSEEPSVITANVGDVAYYTNGEIKTVAITNWNTSLGTPIGVVVIPSNFLPDGKARILSLKAVDSSGNATTSHSSMWWRSTGTDTTLTNYTKVPVVNSQQQVSDSSDYGYLPSDNFNAEQSIVDPLAYYYWNDDNKQIPSPYANGLLNPDYCMEISGNNALSDFNGLSNTQVLVGLSTGFIAANAAWKYNDGVSDTQWYLPSMGELGFMVARFKTINNTIYQLGGVVVPSNSSFGFWSSTEYGSNYAYYTYAVYGSVSRDDKGSGVYVRPFAILDINNTI